jgi:NLI interacting factor-like phosphatase
LNTDPLIPKIFIDLDDTLIHSIYINRSIGLSSRTLVETKASPKGKKEKYASHLRETSYDLLSFCRDKAQTLLLTTATKDYAIKHNEVFNLGFKDKEIISREDYLIEASTAYGGKTTMVAAVKKHPKSLLIDNLSPEEEHAKNKMLFLGIKEDQYIQIREYFGGKDPDVFLRELESIKEKITNFLKKEKDINYKIDNRDVELNID